jgi:hypothetical protein
MTARNALFRKLVSEPWKALVEQARTAWTAQSNPSPTDFDEPAHPDEVKVLLRETRSTLQLGSWLVLADFASFLESYLPTVHAAVRDGVASLSGNAGDVLKVLRQTTIGDALKEKLNPTPPTVDVVAPNLATALQSFIREPALLEDLERATAAYARPANETANPVTANPDYPSFLFPLADPENIPDAAQPNFTGVTGVPTPPAEPSSGTPAGADFNTYRSQVDTLAALVLRALETVPGQPEPAVPAAADRPADLRDGWFHIRCVYERPSCGALHEDVVSAPTEPFKLAGFFDPDAPARPIRIGLPVDTTPAGLRKFDKNTAFVMSDILCGQVARMKGLTLGDLVRTVLPWPLHKDLSVPDSGPCKQGGAGPTLGLICSLSIPIITLCALILLMIMVSLLDFIFRWMPYFIVCFPLPGLRAKKNPAP